MQGHDLLDGIAGGGPVPPRLGQGIGHRLQQPRDACAECGQGSVLCLVIHGHDRDESGYFVENGNQACPVIFGAPRPNKCFLVLDLEGRYDGERALRRFEEANERYQHFANRPH